MSAVERIAAKAVEARAAALADALGAVEGVTVERTGGDLVLSGRGLRARVVTERVLRDPASVLR
ncbi:hypothetical protein [uncultured Sphingomonas sp.]|uniref:hypothetical protein n=1 Tax=uncultured Sphingomonas sp. TaxID=158754 RepID=UPI0035C97EDB